MFSKDSIINEVNIINKAICYFIVVLGLIVCREPIFLLFVNIFLLLITKQYENLFKINIINTVILIISIIYPQILWINKIGTLIIYTILLKKVTKLTELRYLLESTLYRFQQKQVTYKILYIIYFFKYIKNNINQMLILKEDYERKLNIIFIWFVIKKSYQKTKDQLNELMKINKLRFYNYSKNRTYIEKTSWESWNNNYLICHVVIVIITFFYGR